MSVAPFPDIQPIAEDAVLLTFGDAIDPDLTPVIAAWCGAIRQRFGRRVTDLVPSYATITVYYNPLTSDFRFIISELRALYDSLPEAGGQAEAQSIELPVWYHPSVGPDLERLASACELSVDQVIEKHTTTAYQVYALGFSPGFGFMGLVDPAIAHPRLERPRVRVPGGSVGIANRQTAVYPAPSPGGWQLIGRCPTQLFSEQDLALLSVGDTVRFRAIDHATFLSLGGDDTPFIEEARQ
ncbi:5-oxoprolinase subunit PxpB [Marinobacter lacisalsi]|uniref:5-oxoprolinase subunit PxpB n=1 Tax=Marinobacter lacisalsi TaxID=475979 RepID=A0ABV8QLB3_9GAMM